MAKNRDRTQIHKGKMKDKKNDVHKEGEQPNVNPGNKG